MVTNAAVQRWQASGLPSVVAGLGSCDPAPIMLCPPTPKALPVSLPLQSLCSCRCCEWLGPREPAREVFPSPPHLAKLQVSSDGFLLTSETMRSLIFAFLKFVQCLTESWCLQHILEWKVLDSRVLVSKTNSIIILLCGLGPQFPGNFFSH